MFHSIVQQLRSHVPTDCSTYPLQVIVTGHYGCGGVATAITNPHVEESIKGWVQPIRDIYTTSERPEIVALRTANANKADVPSPANNDPGMFAWCPLQFQD